MLCAAFASKIIYGTLEILFNATKHHCTNDQDDVLQASIYIALLFEYMYFLAASVFRRFLVAYILVTSDACVGFIDVALRLSFQQLDP